MKYAGFWSRLAAGVIDFVVFLPIMFLFAWLQRSSYAGSLILVFPYWMLYSAYNIVLLAYDGQTVGKKIMRIRVTRIDGSRIGPKEAVLRHFVDVLFATTAGIGMLLAYRETGADAFTSAYTWTERNRVIVSNIPRFASTADTLSTVWLLSELVVLLFNEKRRAIHDFIAETVVVHVPKA